MDRLEMPMEKFAVRSQFNDTRADVNGLVEIVTKLQDKINELVEAHNKK